jgi:hypothetical protein
MADVTISNLPLGAPLGNALLPYSTGNTTQATPISSLLIGTYHPVGIGTAPNIWNGINNSGFEIGGNPVIAGADAISVVSNAYYNSGWKYTNSTSRFAAQYQVNAGNAGAHAWFNALAGTRGEAITWTQAMTLNSSGNLGIGTISPARQLTVDSVTNPEIGLYTAGTERVKLSTGGSALSQLVIDTAGQPKVIINNTGNMGIGIGAGTPAERLTVSGNISASGDVKASNTAKAWVNFNGTTGATVAGEFRCTIRSAYNVSKVVRNTTGDYSVYFNTALADDNYCAIMSSGLYYQDVPHAETYGASAFRFKNNYIVDNNGNTLRDSAYFNVVIFR